jgi:DNA-binding transcriptional LysR family regulator
MNFSLRQLRYFVTIAELGQVSRAAEQLHVTQSAVTISLRDLESELGYRLFKREPYGMELTDDGRLFLAHAHAVEAAVNLARNIPRPAEASGNLTLAATPTLVGYFLPEHIHRLAGLHPGLRIVMLELDRRGIEAGLLAGTFDIAMLVISNVTDPRLKTQTLVDSQRRLWVPAGHRLAGEEPVSLAEISSEPLMMLIADEAGEAAQRYWAHYGHAPDVRLRSSSIEAIRSMVGNGQGVAIASDMQYRPWSLEGKRVETVRVKEPIPALSVGLAWHAEREFTPAMKIVHDYFRQRFLDPPNRHKFSRR